MKVGILTYHRAYNYGAFLQALALKEYIGSLGHDCSLIDYESAEHSAEYELFNRERMSKWSIPGQIKYILKTIVGLSRIRIRQSRMQQLQHSMLDTEPKPKRTLAELEKDHYDAIIYGSDQIWRKSLSNPGGYFDGVYWGEGFTNVRKIAYAPSMGIINLDDADRIYMTEHLKGFDALSSRERDLKEIITPLTSTEVTQVLDPVFLMPKEYWINKTPKVAKKQKPYILVFNLMHSPDVPHTARILAAQNSWDVVEITSAVQPYRFGANVIQTADPFEFLSLIANAEFIVASSFHATAFSIIFRKNFYAMGMKNNSGRVKSLLEQCGLTSRLIESADQATEIKVNYPQDCLEKEIEISKQYLAHAI